MKAVLNILPAVLALAAGPVCAQVTITGVADKAVYSTAPSILIANSAGYTSAAFLDLQAAPVGTAFAVNKVDYHELVVYSTNDTTLAVSTRLVRFIVQSAERGGTEDGIPPWTPYPLIPSASGEFAGANLRIVVPQAFPAGMQIPVVAWVENAAGHAVRVNGAVTAPRQNPIRLVRGVGSGFLAGTNAAGTLNYAPAVGGLTAEKAISIESGTVWTGVSGAIAGNVSWPENSRIAITNHVILAAGSTLTIGAGTIVRISPGINITNDAALVINGTVEQPVVFTPVSPAQPWGGFLMWNGLGSITGTGVIFTGSGAKVDWFGTGGNPTSHRKEQGLFFCNSNSRITLTDSAAIYLAGQLGHAVNGGTFTFNRFLMQRTTTGGEYSGSSRALRFDVNDSAFIECPDNSANFVDGDNDALYIVHGNHGFTNTLFGFTKDDGIDCGGSGAGVLNLVDCWFESIFHEGTSLSGTGKIVNHIHNTLINCGQAVEVGYDAPTANVSHSLITGNLIGVRQGDNYDSGYTHNGFLNATNNLLLENYRDVWGMCWNDWTYRSNQMSILNNHLTAPDPRWTQNGVWSPATDAPALAGYGYFPQESPVGVGLALRTNRVTLAQLAAGLPIRLSRFSTNVVTVNYALETPAGVAGSGSLVFQPGQTLKFLPVSTNGLQGMEFVTLRLLGASHGEITGVAEAFVLQAVQASTLIASGAVWRFLDTGSNLGTGWVAPAFNDTNWKSGAAQLGFGDQDEISQVASNRQVTTYFRHSFNVPDPGAFGSLTVALLRDDGGVVYINGTEVFRSNLPDGVSIASTNLAVNALPQDEIDYFYTNAFTTPVLVSGTNVCAVEIHQSSATSSDLSFDLKLYGNPVSQFMLKHARLSDGDLLLYWDDPAATLEGAADTAGPWTAVPAMSNPVVVTVQGEQRFFRLKH